MSHRGMSHVTHLNEGCHRYEWGMSHISIQNMAQNLVADINKSWHMYEWVICVVTAHGGDQTSNICIIYSRRVHNMYTHHKWMSHASSHPRRRSDFKYLDWPVFPATLLSDGEETFQNWEFTLNQYADHNISRSACGKTKKAKQITHKIISSFSPTYFHPPVFAHPPVFTPLFSLTFFHPKSGWLEIVTPWAKLNLNAFSHTVWLQWVKFALSPTIWFTMAFSPTKWVKIRGYCCWWRTNTGTLKYRTTGVQIYTAGKWCTQFIFCENWCDRLINCVHARPAIWIVLHTQ